MKTLFSACCFILSVVLPVSSSSLSASQDTLRLYPGITSRQHELAQQSMHLFFDQHWDSSEAVCVEMLKLEQKENLLPMSYLLRFAGRSWRILNDEVANEQEGRSLNRELDPLRSECLRILHNKKRKFPDSTLATRLFLEGGINGFNATLKIRANPFAAMVSGLSSVRLLDSARALAPNMYDACLGLGISQCALANEPGIILAAMRLFRGLHVNLDTGLMHLRTCSQKALYTRDGAMEYLIQFLSPFKTQEAAEKQQIFRRLQALFPGNPFYVFQEIDEEMSFHRREVFSRKIVDWARPLISLFDTCNFSHRRYANLVRWQCAEIDFNMINQLHPIPIEPKTPYWFYPAFLAAAKEQFTLDSEKVLSPKQKKDDVRHYRALKEKSISMVRSSKINPMLREYFLYHIEDGLPK
jgi:hypothetical protein